MTWQHRLPYNLPRLRRKRASSLDVKANAKADEKARLGKLAKAVDVKATPVAMVTPADEAKVADGARTLDGKPLSVGRRLGNAAREKPGSVVNRNAADARHQHAARANALKVNVGNQNVTGGSNHQELKLFSAPPPPHFSACIRRHELKAERCGQKDKGATRGHSFVIGATKVRFQYTLTERDACACRLMGPVGPSEC